MPTLIKRSKVVARMTVKRGATLTTVEITSAAGWTDFYRWYHGRGRGRKLFRLSDRHESLDQLSKRFTISGAEVKIKILQKKLYKFLMTCSPDKLPGYTPVKSRPKIGGTAWQLRGRTRQPYEGSFPIPVAIKIKENVS